MMALSVMLALTLAHLLISFASVQSNNTSPKSCPVTQTQQLTVNGCPVFVHDVTGAKDFVIEPLMCITENISNVLSQYDPFTKEIFVSVPVTIQDETMFVEIQNQLQHLSPKSINFATVSDISISMDASSGFLKVLWFLWSPNESVGYLGLGCDEDSANCKKIHMQFRAFNFDAFNWVTATAKVMMGNAQTELKYKLMLQNQKFFNHEVYAHKFECTSNCDNLEFYRSVIHLQCTARVYQRQDVNDLLYIEPLFCPIRQINESIIFDYSRVMYYLNLDVLLQDEVTLNAVRNELAHLSPAEVSFMQLWRVIMVVDSSLSSRFDVGPLMVSGDWKSGQVRVYCKTYDDCVNLRIGITMKPLSFWSHIKFELKSLIPSQCSVKSSYYITRQKSASSTKLIYDVALGVKYQTKTVDHRTFAIIQQRMSGAVSFARPWHEYEAGFGDLNNFWIGLSTIHSLSINGVTFRVEMKLMQDGSEHHQEYANFKVGDASTNYTMSCGGIIESRSSSTFDSMAHINGVQFSTMDRDNDAYIGSCSTAWGNGGWWFKNCAHSAPNRIYSSGEMWYLNGTWQRPREIRLMLQI